MRREAGEERVEGERGRVAEAEQQPAERRGGGGHRRRARKEVRVSMLGLDYGGGLQLFCSVPWAGSGDWARWAIVDLLYVLGFGPTCCYFFRFKFRSFFMATTNFLFPFYGEGQV